MPEATEQIPDMPRHVREAEDRARQDEERRAAAQAAQAVPAAAPAASEPAPVTDGRQQPQAEPSNAAPAATDGADVTTTGQEPETLEQLKAQLAEKDAQLLENRNRLRRLYGRTNVQHETKDREIENLKGRIAQLETQGATAPSAEDDKVVLKRNGATQEEIDEMTEREIRQEARRWKAIEADLRTLAAERARIVAEIRTYARGYAGLNMGEIVDALAEVADRIEAQAGKGGRDGL